MMNNNKEIEEQIKELIAFLSSELQNIAERYKDKSIEKDVNALFRTMLLKSQKISGSIQRMGELFESAERNIDRLVKQNKRLELLFTTGLSFQSEAEVKTILETAIDILIKELRSSTGYIVFLNELGIVESVVSRNMSDEQEQKAFEMSTSVFRKAIDELGPINYSGNMEDVASKASIINLRVSAALCIPMISGQKVLGAIYLDKRDSNQYFDESDVTFLTTFTKQVVSALDSLNALLALREEAISTLNERFDQLREHMNCEAIIGNSKKLYDVLESVKKVASADIPVFICGENGTGKELIAQSIHNNSPRNSGPFVAINCAAIPSDLLESELFGYEQGAFSGATKAKPGKLEMANNGTFFFDEIGDMSPSLQAKILRVLQNKTVERLGSNQSRQLNVRFIAATNQDLALLVKSKQFREDLYYRIRVIEIKLPPLRERKEDIEILSNYFISKYSDKTILPQLEPEVIAQLKQYEWPGNVRELENVIQRGLVLAKGESISINDLPPEILTEEVTEVQGCKELAEAELDFRREYVKNVLMQVKSKSQAAKVLGVNRTHFYRLLQQLGISYEQE